MGFYIESEGLIIQETQMGKFLEKTRYISIVGVVSLLLASMAAFGWGVMKTINEVIVIATSYGKDPYIAASLIELIDSFLIATALFVFAASMYELFISNTALPDWMLAHNLNELKDKLGGVIILVMVVKFLEHLVEWEDPYASLLFAVAVAVVSIPLIALRHISGTDRDNLPPNNT
jgi:uncharacterized membrane protein YqhA